MIATNAQPIIDARMKGYKPVDMVIVSLVGHNESPNPVVYADQALAYDWRWLHGLDVCVYIGDEGDWSSIVKSLAMRRPEHLNVWHRTGQWGAKVYLIPTAADIAKPVPMWRYELDFLPWLDFQNEDFIECKSYETT